METDVAEAVKGKRILVFEELLQSTGFPDLGVVDELRKGAELVGVVPETNMLPGKFVPAPGDTEIDKVIWRTLEEVDMGWLTGPMDADDVPAHHPVSKRFGLLQKCGKVRLIDEYTESEVNTCVTTMESPILHTVAVASAAISFWFGACSESGRDPKLQVRTFGLASAYRQVALSNGGQLFACIRVFNPEKKRLQFFRNKVLPFGAVRSVHAFLRLARAIWWIGVAGCRLMWTSFYDDFISFSQPRLFQSTEITISALFKLLGWIFAEEGEKCVPFSEVCDALGVSFNLTLSGKGLASVCNTQARVEELCCDLQRILEEGSLGSKPAQRLRGRMQFAEAQLFGRTGRRCLHGNKSKLLPKDKFFLSLFVQMLRLLQQNLLREICATNDKSILIFTDACYERNDDTWPWHWGSLVRRLWLSILLGACGLAWPCCFGRETEKIDYIWN